MSRRGKRYGTEPKLNYKKVLAVIVAIIVLIMIAFIMRSLLTQGNETGKISSTSYFALYADSKWGVISNTGAEVIAPSYSEMIIIPSEKKDVFLCTYGINEETGEYKTKVLNSKNTEIFTEYDKVEALENFDKSNNVWYEDNVLKVEKDGKYGLINLAGSEILPCEYDSIVALTGVKNSIVVEKNNLKGLVNDDGSLILEVNYKDITNLGDDYKNGYIVESEDNKYGVVDYMGKQLLDSNYEGIEKIYGKNLYVVKEDGKQKLVNANGEVLLDEGFTKINQILSYTTSGVVYVKGDKYGVMNTDGDVLIEATYDDLKEVKDGALIAKKDNKYGIIGMDGEEKVEFIYTSITYNSQADIYIADDESYESSIMNNEFEIKVKGILSDLNTDKGYMKLKVNGEYKYYNFKFEEKESKDIYTSNTLFLSKSNGKYGYVNSKGEVVVDYQYDDATEQNSYGYVAVKKDGKWGSLDLNGNVVVEPIYNLDNNYIIDFIGKWHLGQDINMNYYCEK